MATVRRRSGHVEDSSWIQKVHWETGRFCTNEGSRLASGINKESVMMSESGKTIWNLNLRFSSGDKSKLKKPWHWHASICFPILCPAVVCSALFGTMWQQTPDPSMATVQTWSRHVEQASGMAAVVSAGLGRSLADMTDLNIVQLSTNVNLKRLISSGSIQATSYKQHRNHWFFSLVCQSVCPSVWVCQPNCFKSKCASLLLQEIVQCWL